MWFFFLRWHSNSYLSAAPLSHQFSHILPTNEFAALSIAPHTPPRGRHGRESSASSLESTPEVAALSFDGLRLSILDADLGFPEATLPIDPVRRRGCIAASSSLFTIRAHPFTDFMSFQDDEANRFADFSISPLSAPSPVLFN